MKKQGMSSISKDIAAEPMYGHLNVVFMIYLFRLCPGKDTGYNKNGQR